MGSNHENPYAPGTPEHVMWERYQQSYRSQPLSSQLFDLESRYRAIGHAMSQMSADVQPPVVRERLREALRALESTTMDLDDAAERAAGQKSDAS